MRSLFRALFTFPNERRMLLKVRRYGGVEEGAGEGLRMVLQHQLLLWSLPHNEF